MKQQVLIPRQPFMILLTDTYYKRIYNRYGISHFYTCAIMDGVTEISTSIPDGCIDLMFYWNKDRNLYGADIVGSLLAPRGIRVKENCEYFGVRFMPGIMPCMVALPLGEVLEQMLPLGDYIMDKSIIEKIGGALDFKERMRLFLEYYIPLYMQKKEDYGNQRMNQAVIDIIMQNKGNVCMDDIAGTLGYSKQYITRIFSNLNKISPKRFSEIIRFQMMVQALECDDGMNVIYELGFYDQAHFCNEFRKLSGRTPKTFLWEMKNEHIEERLKVV